MEFSVEFELDDVSEPEDVLDPEDVPDPVEPSKSDDVSEPEEVSVSEDVSLSESEEYSESDDVSDSESDSEVVEELSESSSLVHAVRAPVARTATHASKNSLRNILCFMSQHSFQKSSKVSVSRSIQSYN